MAIIQTFKTNRDNGGATLRAWLKDLRETRALTQAQVAKHLNIKQNYYCEIENGKKQLNLNLSMAAKIAKFFDVSLEDIANFEKDRGARHEDSSTKNRTT